MLDRVSQFALVARGQALGAADAACAASTAVAPASSSAPAWRGSQTSDDGYRTLYGEASDRIKPYTVLMGMHNAPAGWIGIEHGLRGPNLTYSTACSSSAVAIGEAWRRVASGELDLAIAGGAEAPLSFGSLKAWEALHTLAAIDPADPSASCKPFSKDRSGMVLGEGAAMLVLEPWERAVARGAPPLGEVIGYGLSTDAGHITRPSVEGQAAAMRAALRVGRPRRGRRSTRSMRTAPARRPTIRSRPPRSRRCSAHARTRSRSARPSRCTVTCSARPVRSSARSSLLAMQHAVVLPTMHLARARSGLRPRLRAERRARTASTVRTMLSSSFAFGGTNAVLALRRAG